MRKDSAGLSRPTTRARRQPDRRPVDLPTVVSGPELIAPYRRVAIHVIARAFRDLASPVDSPTAREFLDDSPMLHHWSAVAALDPASIAASADLLIATLGQAGNQNDAGPDLPDGANGVELKQRPSRPPVRRAGD